MFTPMINEGITFHQFHVMWAKCHGILHKKISQAYYDEIINREDDTGVLDYIIEHNLAYM